MASNIQIDVTFGDKFTSLYVIRLSRYNWMTTIIVLDLRNPRLE